MLINDKNMLSSLHVTCVILNFFFFDENNKMLKIVETFQDFSFKKFTEPVVIVGGCKDMAAIKKWKDVRYMESFITKKVPVEVRMDKQDAGGYIYI